LFNFVDLGYGKFIQRAALRNEHDSTAGSLQRLKAGTETPDKSTKFFLGDRSWNSEQNKPEAK
jgi:hypothetical protein